MDRLEIVRICKRCSHRTFDMSKGVLCGLTGKAGDFENECPTYDADEQAIIKEDKVDKEKLRYMEEYPEEFGISPIGTSTEESNRNIPPEKFVKRGSNWFYIIATLSLVCSVALFSGYDFYFFVGLGITQLLDYWLLSEFQDPNTFHFFPSFIICFGFALFGYFGRKRSKQAFLIGMIIYAIDTLLFLLILDVMSIVFHLIGLFIMLKGYKAISELEVPNNTLDFDENLT